MRYVNIIIGLNPSFGFSCSYLISGTPGLLKGYKLTYKVIMDILDSFGNKDIKGRFNRTPSSFRNFITNDGSSAFQAQADRYHLYVSYACPWAHRTLIMRKLKGLEW